MENFQGCHKCKYISKEVNEYPCNECIRIAIEKFKPRKIKEKGERRK